MASENTVVEFILNSNSAVCRLNSLCPVFDNNKPFYILNTLKTFRRIKVLVKTSDLSQSLVFVFIRGLRLCAHSMHCKKDSTCSFLHLCPEFVSGTCNRSNCQFSHDFHDKHNRLVIEKFGIDDLCQDDGVLLELVQCCTPIVCLEHNGVDGSGCSEPELCMKLHVCDEYFCNRCLLSNSECLYGHDLYSERNTELLALFELDHLRTKNEKFLRKLILKAGSSYLNKQVRKKVGVICLGKYVERTDVDDRLTKNENLDVKKPSRSEDCLQQNPVLKSAMDVNLCSGRSRLSANSKIQIKRKQEDEDKFLGQLKPSSVSDKDLHSSKSRSIGDHVVQIGKKQGDGAELLNLPRPTSEIVKDHQSGLRDNQYSDCTTPGGSKTRDQGQSTTPGCSKTHDQVRSDSAARFLPEGKFVCEKFESHECFSSSVCTDRHVSEPYCWRVQLGSKWYPLEAQNEVEVALCNPECSDYLTAFMGNKIKIDFETMTCELGAVQRLSTPSYVTCRDKTDVTHWRWYWKDGGPFSGMWLLYEDDKPPYQDVLEAKYLHDKTQPCWFETSYSQQYIIDFVEMKQTNLRTGFKREVRRRPADKRNIGKISQYRFHFDPSKLPIIKRWVPMNTDIDYFSDLIPIAKDRGKRMDHYSKIETKFFKKLSKARFEIQHVYYVQNLHLWKCYQEKKERMVSSGGSHLEQLLFHGTVDEKTVKCICHQNFDPRMHGVHGTRYGKGAYFATTAKYSHDFTKPFGDGNRRMFLARVLVGKSTLGDTSYQRPPPLDSSRPHGALYDTCVNDVDDPSIYVVFDNVQCYPEFLIEYKDLHPPSPVPATPQVPQVPARVASTSQLRQYQMWQQLSNQTQSPIQAASISSPPAVTDSSSSSTTPVTASPDSRYKVQAVSTIASPVSTIGNLPVSVHAGSAAISTMPVAASSFASFMRYPTSTDKAAASAVSELNHNLEAAHGFHVCPMCSARFSKLLFAEFELHVNAHFDRF